MKTAIVTLTDGQNYGNRLQNYALQTVLENLGCSVQTIRRRTYKDPVGLARIKRIIKNIIKMFIGRPYGKYVKHRRRAFDRFNDHYVHFSREMLHDNKSPKGFCTEYDFFIVGSDQVWNAGFRIVNEDILNYLLCFANPEQRISYAASFGTNKIADGYEELFHDELPKFKAISVREENGVKLVEECGSRATTVLDPTMLLTSQEWLKIAKKPSYVTDKPFVVSYFLSGRDKEISDYLNRVAVGCEIINLDIESVRDDRIEDVRVYATSPDEFVWLLSNANCIITDSFHATVFAILFHKPFCVFERRETNESYKMGSRIDTLLGLFNLEKYRDSERRFDIVPKEYETDEIERILYEEREKSIDYLRRALSK